MLLNWLPRASRHMSGGHGIAFETTPGAATTRPSCKGRKARDPRRGTLAPAVPGAADRAGIRSDERSGLRSACQIASWICPTCREVWPHRFRAAIGARPILLSDRHASAVGAGRCRRSFCDAKTQRMARSIGRGAAATSFQCLWRTEPSRSCRSKSRGRDQAVPCCRVGSAADGAGEKSACPWTAQVAPGRIAGVPRPAERAGAGISPAARRHCA